ncbi:MAG: hypothetical protein WBV82_14560 [Myxococcaceae bacterium]
MRKKIGELLVEMGATRAEEIQNALGQQRAMGGVQRLGQVLVSMGKVTSEQVAKALSLQFDVPFIDLPEISAAVSSLVPIEVQSEHRIIPFRLELDGKVERLHLAVADPTDLGLAEDIRFQLGKQVKLWVASSSDIDEVLRALRGESIAEIDPIEIDEDAPDGFDLPLEWGAPEPQPPVQPPPPPAPVEVVKFSPAPKPPKSAAPSDPVPDAPAPIGAAPRLEFSEEDLKILENIERIADGGESDPDSSRVKPEQMVASLVRLLLRKGVIQEDEFLDELARK